MSSSTTSSSTPTYIYKIVPSSSPPSSSLPLVLPVSSLDAKDGFIHLSTSSQILNTLRLFFANEELVYILRIPFERVKEFTKWETVCGDVGLAGKEGVFPHVYANGADGGLKLGKEEVDEVGVWVRGDEGWGTEGWCFGEDKPE